MKAVIDRFEGDVAVLLVGDESRQVTANRSQLPQEAQEGQWLNVEMNEAGNVTSAVVDPAATNDAKQRIMRKMAALRNRPQE